MLLLNVIEAASQSRLVAIWLVKVRECCFLSWCIDKDATGFSGVTREQSWEDGWRSSFLLKESIAATSWTDVSRWECEDFDLLTGWGEKKPEPLTLLVTCTGRECCEDEDCDDPAKLSKLAAAMQSSAAFFPPATWP